MQIGGGAQPFGIRGGIGADLAENYARDTGVFGGRKDVRGSAGGFVIASVYADGKLDESEYLLMAPLLKAFFGEDFDFEDAKKLAKEWRKEGRAVKKEVDYLVDFLGTLSEELKGDIIFACLLMCAVDGKVSLKEKSYIRQLMR